MSERNYEIIPPFDEALNKRLNEYTGVVSQGKPGHDEAQELLPLPEDSMEARLQEARIEERDECAARVKALFDQQAGIEADDVLKAIQGEPALAAIMGETNGEEGDREDGAETEGNVSPE